MTATTPTNATDGDPDAAPRQPGRGGGRRRLVFKLVAVAVGLLLALLVAEVALRLVRETGRFYPHSPDAISRRGPFTEEATPGVEGWAYLTTNQFGCRGPEPAGERHRMLVVGGSTANCLALDDAETWPQLVMDGVNEHFGDPKMLWVTNSGKEGRNALHHVIHARYLLPRIPDVDHALLYCGLNDIGKWLFEETFAPVDLADEASLQAAIGASFYISDHADPDEPWFEGLELWRAVVRVKAAVQTWAFEDRNREYVISGADYEGWLQKRKQRRREVGSARLDAAKASTLEAALDTYGARLREFVTAARAAGSEPIFMAQYVECRNLTDEEETHIWMGEIDGGRVFVDPDQMQDLVEQFNDRMRAVAVEMSLPFVDLPALLKGQRGLCHDGVHFNERGAALAARAIADFLIERVYTR